MEHLRGYDAWKERVPDPGGSGGESGHSRTKMLWFRSYRFMQRQGEARLDAWLNEQRQIPAYAGFVKWVDEHSSR